MDDLSKEKKILGADAAAVARARSAEATDVAPHVAPTELPWSVSRWHEPRGGVSPCIVSGGATIAKLHVAPITPADEAEANAEFIVRACNTHTELLGALKSLLEDDAINLWLGGNPNHINAVIARAQAAILKAEEGKQ